jgi:hypothetical protein
LKFQLLFQAPVSSQSGLCSSPCISQVKFGSLTGFGGQLLSVQGIRSARR